MGYVIPSIMIGLIFVLLIIMIKSLIELKNINK